MKVKLSDVIETIEMSDDFSEFFLDKITEEIEWINEMGMTSEEKEEIYEQLDEHGFYRFPTKYEIHDYSIIENFVSTRTEFEREKLSYVIKGRGAFRRFKDEILYMGIEQDWYNYRDNAYKNIAIEWCEENGIEYET